MSTLYLTNSGRILINENGEAKSFDCAREAIKDIFRIEEDMNIVYSMGEKKVELTAKAGDVVVTFYEGTFPNPVIVVSNDMWRENLKAYEDEQQRIKEEWAKKSAAKCEDCENTCRDAWCKPETGY